ncbi:MAG TPA: hypothetical protein ENI96_12755 [Sedimenticola thiotaurini]|uniref:Uncharacterized protein n=1 Tax=Sedimenticola thiotaurini TaxID=1543721 RepID=A0A831RM94_9GAMM|nr:hypothetical protein [Sedimenticola thiotaurini]
MRLVVSMLLFAAATAAFAQSAPKGRAAAPDFGQVKQMMLPMLKKTLPALEQTRDCLEQSGNSEDLKRCAAIMLDFRQAARASMGIPEGGPHARPVRPEDLDLEWSPEMKQAMLKDIDQSIRGTRTMVSCLESSSSDQEMTGCVEQSGLLKRKR